jgi:hypothetical protein
MRRIARTSAGSGPALSARRWTILAAGLVALCLQVMAQVMPADAMQNAMRVATLSADDVQSFAGTCLGFGPRNDSQPAKLGNHASCPVCFTLAQTHGFAPAPLDLATVVAWSSFRQMGIPAPRLAQSLAAASFASRAPPAPIG